jgi:hypothetical protein
MAKRSVELREMAGECRSLAVLVHYPEIREQLLEIAEQFERLARHHEFVEMTAAPSRASFV